MVVLIKEIYQAVDIPASVVKNMVAVLPDVVSNPLLSGESVTITVFGRFEVKERAARTGRNPKADETVFMYWSTPTGHLSL